MEEISIEVLSAAINKTIASWESKTSIKYNGSENDSAYVKACWLIVQLKELKIYCEYKHWNKDIIHQIILDQKFLSDNLERLKITSKRHNNERIVL